VTIGARVLGAAAAFMGVVDAVYWFVTYEPAGTFLLGVTAVGLLFASGYIAAASRGTVRPADRPDLRPEDVAGEPVGVFAAASPWPIVLAGGLLVALVGLVYGLWLLIPGMAITIAALLGLAWENSRA
jgi:cytochrome c oxidase subunit IV